MEASTDVVYSVVINEPNYLGSIQVIDKDIGHLVKFELKENNHQSDQVINRRFRIIKCYNYVASSGPNILVLDGYGENDIWLFTLQCEMDGRITYHEYQQPALLTICKPFNQSQQSEATNQVPDMETPTNKSLEPSSKVGNYKDNVIYQKARKVLEMDDNDSDNATILEVVNCDQAFFDKVYSARTHFPSSFFDTGPIYLAVRDHYIERETSYR
jgi:hypothetical protein